ncbi:MAG: hypothetical protein K0Q55_3834 [Verrucomicrobia bacterium]|nr:hypothetical protein [Verrucomicrobiota bacterium]
MRVLRALSIVAAIYMTHSAFACEVMHKPYEAATEPKIIALLNEPVLLNTEDLSQLERLQEKPIALSDEPVLLNRADLNQSEVRDSAEEGLPGAVGALELPRLQVVMDDEGILLLDVEYTGSNSTDVSAASVDSDEWAIDGFEDR